MRGKRRIYAERPHAGQAPHLREAVRPAPTGLYHQATRNHVGAGLAPHGLSRQGPMRGKQRIYAERRGRQSPVRPA